MSARFGSSEIQDVVPIATTSASILDPKIRITTQEQPPQTPMDATTSSSSSSSSASKHHKKHTKSHKHGKLSRKRPRDEFEADSLEEGEIYEEPVSPPPAKRHMRGRERERERDSRDRRRYRPDSPTDSVNSDFEILANKEKLKENVEADKTPMDDLGDKFIPPRDDSHDMDDGFDDEEMMDDYRDSEDGMGDDDGYDDFNDHDTSRMDEDDPVDGDRSFSSPDMPKLTYEETIERKAAILAELDRRATSGERIDYNEKMTLEQLSIIQSKLIHKSRSLHTVKLLRQAITMYASFLEWASRRFPRLDIDLTDFSKDIFSKKNDYDDMLYEIYNMYSENMKLNPVIMLLLTITGQALMYSAARNFVKNIEASMFAKIPPIQAQRQAAPTATPAGTTTPVGVSPIDLDDPDFDKSELLELCRQEAESKQNATASEASSSSSSSSSSASSGPSGDGAITIDIPSDTSGGIQIIRGAQPSKRKSKKTTTTNPKSGGGGETNNTGDDSNATATSTQLWDPNID